MKESTRYALLLYFVLTFITSSYIAINALGGPAEPEQSERENEVNNTVPEINETNNSTNNSTDNTSEASVNETDNGETSENNSEEPEGLIGKSVQGFKLLFSDLGEGIEILAN